MVGNDIVDLRDPDTREGARHPRFDRRVFAASELRRLESDDADGRLRWIFWAVKEGAYKVARRRSSTLVFAPSRFVVELDAAWRGHARHADDFYPFRVSVGRDHVHAVVTDPCIAFEEVHAGFRRLASSESTSDAASREARSLALARVAERMGVPPGSLSIERRDRIPRLIDSSGRERMSLSLSHHGRFVAYACAPAATATRIAC